MTKIPKLSLCMIVKNESKYIDACLNSVKDIMDEIIIVDTGSTDNTKEIVSKYTDKIYDFEWVNDFAKARNYSFSKATGQYIMWLDADDILLEEDRKRLKRLKTQLSDKIVPVSMTYDYAFDNSGNVTLSLKRNRIIKNENKKDVWVGFVHEIIPVNINDSYESDVHITHTRSHSNGTRNLDIFESKLKSGMVFDSRNTLYYAKELYYNSLYDRAIEEFTKFLSMADVWIEDVIDVLIKMADIYSILGNTTRERQCLQLTFDYAIRAEALFPLGMSYAKEKKYDQAIFFLESILTLEFPKDCNGFLRNDEWNIKPLIELSCCYYYKGDKESAKHYHGLAKQIDPTNQTVIYNDQFFN